MRRDFMREPMPERRSKSGDLRAENVAAGIRDLRPRKDGPVYDVVMEYVGNKKRKAVAVHRWIKAAENSGQGAGARRDRTPDTDLKKT